MKKKVIFAVIGLILATVVIMRILNVRVSENTTEPSGFSPVKAGVVKSAAVSREYKYAATVKARAESVVYPHVPGIVREKLKEAGSYVKEDENILMIDRNEVALKYSMSAVKSPIDGQVLRVFADIGNRVTPQTPVAVVGDMSYIKAGINVAPADINLIKKGMKVRIVYPADKNIYGRVTEVSDMADERSGKFPVEITAQNKTGLKSGITCDIFLTVEEINTGKAVPLTAVTERNGDTGIFKITSEGRAEWVEVRIVNQGVDIIAVEGDISTGDSIVVEGSYGLIPGREVKILK